MSDNGIHEIIQKEVDVLVKRAGKFTAKTRDELFAAILQDIQSIENPISREAYEEQWIPILINRLREQKYEIKGSQLIHVPYSMPLSDYLLALQNESQGKQANGSLYDNLTRVSFTPDSAESRIDYLESIVSAWIIETRTLSVKPKGHDVKFKCYFSYVFGRKQKREEIEDIKRDFEDGNEKTCIVCAYPHGLLTGLSKATGPRKMLYFLVAYEKDERMKWVNNSSFSS